MSLTEDHVTFNAPWSAQRRGRARGCSNVRHTEEFRHFVVEKAFSRFIGLYPFSVENELRNGALARAGNYLTGSAGRLIDIDFRVRDCVLVEEALGLAAVAAPVG